MTLNEIERALRDLQLWVEAHSIHGTLTAQA